MGSDLIADLQIDFDGDFDTQVENVLRVVRLSRPQVDDLQRLFIDLQSSLQMLWPGCQVLPYGSIVTGLGIQSSDIDVYVYVPEGDDEHNEVNFVRKARKVLWRRPMVYYQPFAITAAKIPIVKFYHIPTGRNCDVSFKSPAGVRNSQLIGHLLHMDARALPFTVLIKYWFKVHKLTGTNLIPNYALTMLAIFYLQQKSILPSIVKLQSPNNSFYVDGWNTAFNEQYIHETENKQSLYELLGGYFEFYSSFNFEEYIISTFTGQSYNRELFKNIEYVPKEFELYKRNIANKSCIPIRVDTKLCVQDPFEHCRNSTVAVFPRLAQCFILHLQLAATIYKANKSNDFLRDILTKKPSIPPELKKRKHKGTPKDPKLPNTEGVKNEDNNEVPDDSKQPKQAKEFLDTASASLHNTSDFLHNKVVLDNKPTTNTNILSDSEVIRPKKRNLHSSLADLYRQTKKRKI